MPVVPASLFTESPDNQVYMEEPSRFNPGRRASSIQFGAVSEWVVGGSRCGGGGGLLGDGSDRISVARLESGVIQFRSKFIRDICLHGYAHREVSKPRGAPPPPHTHTI